MATETRGLLYVDILGTKKLWQTRGVARGRGRMDVFASLTTDGIRSAKREFKCNLMSGEIGTDSAAFLFATVEDAILAGVKAYQVAFAYDDEKDVDARIYLRGVIVRTNDTALPTIRKGYKNLENVSRVFHSAGLMNAVILENSGLKGMRLITPNDSGSSHTWSQTAERYWSRKGTQSRAPLLSTLGSGAYSNGMKMLDVQWPIDTRRDFRRRSERLERRVVAAKGDGDEQRHLKATQLLFRKTGQILKSSTP